MWNVRNARVGCASQPLAELLGEQLSDKEASAVTAHLDQCEVCQRRLTELSAEANWWREAGQWLENSLDDEDNIEDCLDDEFNDHRGTRAEESLKQCGLMHVSSNPEMIGAIGRYEIRKLIGTGGTGIVLQAVDTELDRVVAVKVLSPALAQNAAARRRFSREGQAAAAVVHENVVSIHQVESKGPVPFLVMQYVEGCSLQEHVTRSGPLDSVSTLRVIVQLASALDAAHAQGLVHRDIKPANILVGTAGLRVWITDFGLARAVDDASLTRTGFIAGTPHYMSPEQARGETVNASSDLFGLGSVMYFALTGRPPFRAERSLAILNRICNEAHRPVREVNPDVPPSVAAIVDRLLEKSPSSRFAAASELREHCAGLLSSSDALRAPIHQQQIRIKRKSKRIKLVVGVSALLVALASLWRWQALDSYAESRKRPVAFKSQTIPKLRIQSSDSTTEPTIQTGRPSRMLVPKSLPPQDKPKQQPPSNSSPSDASTTSPDIAPAVSNDPPSEHDHWQDAFFALERELKDLNVEWLLQPFQQAGPSELSSSADSFMQSALHVDALLSQLETPLADAIQPTLQPN